MMKKKGTIIVLILGVFFFTPNLESAWTFKRLTWNPGRSWTPAIAIDSNNHIHLVWQDDSLGNDEIFYKQSTDEGTNWSARKRLTWNSGLSLRPSIALDSNNHIHVVWQDDSPGNKEIFYKQSTDGGTSWTFKRLTWNSGDSWIPTIATDSNNHIHVVWYDATPGKAELFYKQSTDSGENWITKRLTWNAGYSSYPAIASDSNNHLHVVWCWDRTGFYNEIYYKQSTDSGENWITKRLTWFSGDSYEPIIALDSNYHIHVVWYDRKTYIGNYEIYYKQSTDSGVNWATKRLTWNTDDSYEPAITIDSNNHIHVVWTEGAGFPEIFYKQSTDSGATWSRERLTWNPGASYYPAIASDTNNHIHVVWNDTTPGNSEIFYKKKD